MRSSAIEKAHKRRLAKELRRINDTVRKDADKGTVENRHERTENPSTADRDDWQPE